MNFVLFHSYSLGLTTMVFFTRAGLTSGTTAGTLGVSFIEDVIVGASVDVGAGVEGTTGV